MNSHRKIERILKGLAIISFIYGFIHTEIFGELYYYLIAIGFQYVFTILIIYYLKGLESVQKLTGIFYLTFLIFCFQYEYLNIRTRDMHFYVLFGLNAMLMCFLLFKLFNVFIKQLNKNNSLNRIESTLLGVCFILNLIGISLNFFYVLLSIMLFLLGASILFNPLLLLNFIFKWHDKGLKFFFIFYFIISNTITLFFLFLLSEEGRDTMTVLQTIWPTINIVTGVIWAILLLLHQKTGSKDNVYSNCSDMAGSKISFQNN